MDQWDGGTLIPRCHSHGDCDPPRDSTRRQSVGTSGADSAVGAELGVPGADPIDTVSRNVGSTAAHRHVSLGICCASRRRVDREDGERVHYY